MKKKTPESKEKALGELLGVKNKQNREAQGMLLRELKNLSDLILEIDPEQEATLLYAIKGISHAVALLNESETLDRYWGLND